MIRREWTLSMLQNWLLMGVREGSLLNYGLHRTTGIRDGILSRGREEGR